MARRDSNEEPDTEAMKCVYRSACSCQMADGSGMINLQTLSAPHGATPTFDNITGKDGNLYSFNPCIPFSLSSSSCKDIALCSYDVKQNKYIGLGTEDSASFIYNDERKEVVLKFSKPNATMTNRTKGLQGITTHMSLQCSEKTDLSVEGQVNETFYYMVLHSPCACLDGCVQRLSAGSIILITSFFLLFSYLFVGILYNRTVYNAAGWEQLPNYGFWSGLPGLIKDGYLFFISPCLGDRVEYRYYERL